MKAPRLLELPDSIHASIDATAARMIERGLSWIDWCIVVADDPDLSDARNVIVSTSIRERGVIQSLIESEHAIAAAEMRTVARPIIVSLLGTVQIADLAASPAETKERAS